MKSYRGAGVQLTDDHHTGTRTEMVQVDDDRWHHRFGASWLKTADLCPERARLEHEHAYEDVESDAASCGTAVHAAIETCLHEQNEGQPLDEQTTVEVFNDTFTELTQLPTFRYIKWKTERGPREFGEHCVQQWHRRVLPTLPERALLETHFCLPLIDDEHRYVELSGGIDYIGDHIIDWKTNGRDPYAEWEYKRWAVQPTFYTWAARLIVLDLPLIWRDDVGHVSFEYCVMSRKGVQRFTVERGPDDWAWLQAKVLAFCELIEADLTTWPKQDNHALCSPKWCPSWDACKGKHLGAEPW